MVEAAANGRAEGLALTPPRTTPGRIAESGPGRDVAVDIGGIADLLALMLTATGLDRVPRLAVKTPPRATPSGGHKSDSRVLDPTHQIDLALPSRYVTQADIRRASETRIADHLHRNGRHTVYDSLIGCGVYTTQ